MSVSHSVAILLPCYNESAVIAQVIADFRTAMPEARIYVYDNNSTDNTAEIAAQNGAIVKTERMKGKGNVVRRMFADIDADIYVMADGDGTYDAAAAPALIQELLNNDVDVIVGTRLASYGATEVRPGHDFGNKMLTGAVNFLFKSEFSDILSGYRVMTRRYVKSCPMLASGFEVETLLTIHCLEVRAPYLEIEVDYRDREEGSVSKLNTYKDGMKILMTVLYLFKDIKPFLFFGSFTIFFVLLGLLFGVPVIFEYFDTGLVERFPTAILATGLMLLGAIALMCGLILNAVARSKREIKRLYYQQYSIH